MKNDKIGIVWKDIKIYETKSYQKIQEIKNENEIIIKIIELDNNDLIMVFKTNDENSYSYIYLKLKRTFFSFFCCILIVLKLMNKYLNYFKEYSIINFVLEIIFIIFISPTSLFAILRSFLNMLLHF